MSRRAAKIDANQKEIVAGIRSYGATVLHLHAVHNGCPDILVGYKGNNYLFEIKNPERGEKSKNLTPDQIKFFETWGGNAFVITHLDEVLEIINQWHC